MDKLLAESMVLDHTLLMTDEEQYDKQASLIISRCQRLTSKDLAAKDVLDTIDPTTHTIPYIYSLLGRIDAVVNSGKAPSRQLPGSLLPEGALWPYITQILLNFDPIQVRYVGEGFIKIVAWVVNGAEVTRNYIPAIQLLHQVILRLDNTSTTFTSTHYSYVRLCLSARAYSEAIDILDRPIYHIPAAVDKHTELRSYKYLCSSHQSSSTYLTPHTGLTAEITTRRYLEYYLMGGMCYLGLGLYAKAITFFEMVLVAPTQQNVVSVVMVEAYKKWLLCHLLVHGTSPNLPKSANQTAMRHARAIAKPYDCVADAFKARNAKRLRAEIEEGTDIWQEDENYGLMIEVYNAYRKFAIQRLGKTYAAIPLSEVARKTSSDQTDTADTPSYIQQLIQTGNLNATITPAKSGGEQILRFLLDSSNQKSEAQVEQQLTSQTIELQRLLKEINDNDHRTEIQKEYIDLLKKLKKARDETKKNGAASGAPVADDDDDENMMDEY